MKFRKFFTHTVSGVLGVFVFLVATILLLWFIGNMENVLVPIIPEWGIFTILAAPVIMFLATCLAMFCGFVALVIALSLLGVKPKNVRGS